MLSIMGHSFGGSTAMMSCMKNKKFKGVCIALDPCLYIFDDPYLTKDMDIPLLAINSNFYCRLYPYFENKERMTKLSKY